MIIFLNIRSATLSLISTVLFIDTQIILHCLECNFCYVHKTWTGISVRVLVFIGSIKRYIINSGKAHIKSAMEHFAGLSINIYSLGYLLKCRYLSDSNSKTRNSALVSFSVRSRAMTYIHCIINSIHYYSIITCPIVNKLMCLFFFIKVSYKWLSRHF